MTERKPLGLSFESWVDRLIREARERGEFDDLPGAGKPLPDRNKPYDPHWWVKQKMLRENLSCLPPTLRLRKEAEDTLAAAMRAPSEHAVRRLVTDLNSKIAEAIRKPLEGPPLNLVPFDIERVVADWRQQR